MNFYLGSSNHGGSYIGDLRRTTVNLGAGDLYKIVTNPGRRPHLATACAGSIFGPLSEAHSLLANLDSVGHLTVNGRDGSYESNWLNSVLRTQAVLLTGYSKNQVADDIFVTPRHLLTPQTQYWDLNIERQRSGNASFELGYVGSSGTLLLRLILFDHLPIPLSRHAWTHQ